MTTPDDRLREAAAALRRTERSVPTFARVQQRVRRRRAISGVAAAAVVVAILLPLAVLHSGRDRVEITNRGATTVPEPSVPSTGIPVIVHPTSPTTVRRTTAPASTTGPNGAGGSIHPQRIALVAPGHAWLVGQSPLTVSRTSDGGLHWTDVTPTGSQASNDGTVEGFFAHDERDAVLAVSGGANAVVLLHTTDGGATWTTVLLGPYESQYFSFVSQPTGWVEASRGAAAGSEAVDILRTRDGGAHWDPVSRSMSLDGQDPGTPGGLQEGCDKTGIGFVDDNTGFATGICASSGYYFYATHDSGRTWKSQALPTPPGVTPTAANPSLYWEATLLPPAFDGTKGAGIAVSTIVTNSTTATHHDYVYFTRDRGAHWSLADPPLRDATWARVVDANSWWAGNATTLVHTSDAGAHWSTMANTGLDLGISPELGDLQFPSPASGWALVGDQSTGELRLLDTDDGGRTWQPVPLPTIP